MKKLLVISLVVILSLGFVLGSCGAPEATGTLRACVSAWIETTDPNLLTDFEFLLWEHLIGIDEEGNFIPELATEWSVSEDGLVWTYNIREGVEFHNGDPLTSADVKFSIERVQVEGSSSPWKGEYTETIDRVECPDDYTVKIYCKKVNYMFYTSIWGCTIVPKNYIEENGDEYFREHPIGTAPWKFVRLTPGVSIECEAVEDHWRITPEWKNLIIELVPESSTALAKLRNGETDIVGVNMDEALEVQDEGYELRILGRPTSPVIPLLGTWAVDGPTSDIRVRQALSLAINREEIAEEFFNGLAEPGGVLWTAPTSWGFDPGWEDEYFEYDPDEARTLLQEAGYPDAFDDPVIKIYSHTMGGPWLPDLNMIISNYWNEVGVQTEVVNIEGGELRTQMYGAAEPSIYGGACIWNMPTMQVSIPFLMSALHSGGNWQLMHDTTFDNLWASITAAPDQEEQISLFRETVEYYLGQYVCPGIVKLYTYYAVSDEVGEWTLRFGYGLYGGFAGMKKR